MKFLVYLFCALPLIATDTVHYVDLAVSSDGTSLSVTPTLQKMLSYGLVNNEDYALSKSNVEMILDAPLRQTAFLLRTLERNRGALLESSGPYMVLKYKFILALRDVKGEPLEKKEYIVRVGLATEAGKGVILIDNESLSHSFTIQTLSQEEEYKTFVKHVVFPFETVKFAQPAASECFIDLYYEWPDLIQDDKKKIFDLFPAWLTYGKGPVKEVLIHLGTTFLAKEKGQWQQTPSAYLHTASSAIDDYTGILKQISEGNLKQSIQGLEEYVSRVPGDTKALKRLMDLYLEDEQNEAAYNLINRFQPMFATIRGGLPNQKALAEKAEQKRNWLLGRRANFRKDEQILLKITSPSDGDLVTGTTELKFSLSGKDTPILAVDCFIGDQLIAQFTQPPFVATFNVDGQPGDQALRVAVYFEDETYQEDMINVSAMKVDENQNVRLVGLRASVFQKGTQGELKADAFQIKENGNDMKINSFRKDTAPLRIAIVLDTSISMVGPKLHRAQYAVKTFLSKLAPEDRASIYTFDQQVIKLSDFTNDYPTLSKQAMTLSMQWGTSLYDAMLIAHDALLGQNGTKVMIVVSDGDDSASSTTDIHVVNAIRDSSVLVYSVILPGGIFQDGDDGERLLKGIAELSGSISHRINDSDKLSGMFDQVYQDLKSFYYLDYYSTLEKNDETKIEVKLKGVSGKIRSRQVN